MTSEIILGEIGGGFRETELWTNPSVGEFNSQTINLNNYISSYKYLKIKFQMSTTLSDESYIIIDASNFKNIIGGASGWYASITVAGSDVNNKFTRCCSYESDNQIKFISCMRWNNTGSGTASINNNYLIPTYIYGLR